MAVQLTEPEYLNPTAAAGFLGLSKSQFYVLRRAGELPKPLLLSPRNPRWKRSELAAWADTRRIER